MHISIFDLHISTFDIHISIFDLERSIFDLCISIFDLCRSTFEIRISILDLHSHAAIKVHTATAQEKSYFVTVVSGRFHSANPNPTTIAVRNVMLTMYAGGAPILARGR
jgi:hypothetical protein